MKRYIVETDKQLISITGTCTTAGKSAHYELIRPNGTQEVLFYVRHTISTGN